MPAAFQRFVRYRRWGIITLHLGLVAFGYWLTFHLRFEFPLAPEDWQRFLKTLPLILVLRFVAFGRFHLYAELWRYVSMRDILAIFKAVTLSSIVFALAVLGLVDADFPWPIFPIDWGTCLLFVGGGRLTLRAIREWRLRSRGGRRRQALIIGAGDAGELMIREIGRNASLSYHVVGFVDDNRAKQGRRIHGVAVIGQVDQLPALCRIYDVEELLIAIPSATSAEMRRIIGTCRAAKVDFKTMPSLGELSDHPFRLSAVRKVSIEDLLRREPVRINYTEVERFVSGKRIFVTGAGGSIGSELCRQLARVTPEKLVLVDRAENSLFFLEMELRERFPDVALQAVICDVTDETRTESIFQMYRPHIVFHAAAHKHVPLMEANKTEAVKNNVHGTMVVANASWHTGVEVFVMISTDKAVRPTSVMGATKRLAEMYVQSLNAKIETRFMTVRFGNVLGSEGSVLQVFQRQIEAGGPITVTHPDMRRYFMTIPEACLLVLQAAAQGEGGEIFVLNMGEAVRIVDLAKDLLTLVGLELGKDIEITFTGVRPGEKLFEELLNPETRMAATKHEKILVVDTTPANYDRLERGIRDLLAAREAGHQASLVGMLMALVPEYRPNGDPPPASPELRRRILLADDDAYTRSTLKRILENRYEVFEATARRQLLDEVEARSPDVVILDHDLPSFSVRRLCARIKTANGHPPPSIILLTESVETVSLEQVRALGADDRVYRPIPVRILETRVARLIAARTIPGQVESSTAEPDPGTLT